MIQVLVIIYYILFAFSFIFGMYFAITGLFGFKNYHKSMFDRHKPKYKFAIIVPSRNEEKVIGALIKSLDKQNYPKDLYETIIVPNNCTDDTAGAAKKAGATVMECTVPVKVKADVLQFVFEKLKPRKDIDAYVIFDSDNLVHPNFLARMNDALCEGVEVAQCFRDSKNMGDNWLTGSYTLFYFIQNFFFNRARMNFSGSAAINGTGFVIKKITFRKKIIYSLIIPISISIVYITIIYFIYNSNKSELQLLTILFIWNSFLIFTSNIIYVSINYIFISIKKEK